MVFTAGRSLPEVIALRKFGQIRRALLKINPGFGNDVINMRVKEELLIKVRYDNRSLKVFAKDTVEE